MDQSAGNVKSDQSGATTVILVIDNFDSFVHNLARYLRQLGNETVIYRNDQIDADSISKIQPDAIVISPGPCSPDQAGCSLNVVQQLAYEIPILGVCLGHQAIVQSFGGNIVCAGEPVHGRSTRIRHNETGVFEGLPTPLTVGRYHSLVAAPDSLPDCLRVTATTDDGIVLAVSHRELPVVGLQFHPESILTEHGYAMLDNFLKIAGCERRTVVPKN